MYFSHRNTTRWTIIPFYIVLYVFRKGLHCKICVEIHSIFRKTVNAKTCEFCLFKPNYLLFFKSIWTLLILSTLDIQCYTPDIIPWLTRRSCISIFHPPPTNVNDDSTLRYHVFTQTTKSPIKMCCCTSWSTSNLGAYVIMLVLSCCCSNVSKDDSTQFKTLIQWDLHVYACLHCKCLSQKVNEPRRDKTNKLTCAPSKDSDQPGHPPSLIRVFAVRSMGSYGSKFSSCAQRRLWSDGADAQADLSLRWAHRPFCWFCHDAAQMLFNNEQFNTESSNM